MASPPRTGPYASDSSPSAGEFECYLTEMNDTKTWTSVEYPGLLVKMEGKQTTMELISFDK